MISQKDRTLVLRSAKRETTWLSRLDFIPLAVEMDYNTDVTTDIYRQVKRRGYDVIRLADPDTTPDRAGGFLIHFTMTYPLFCFTE
uniref:Uncharacterized protein n=1 Tax=Acrobeloides nanus TaxID=290746 RepID=A0A914C528_9BILA